jgi:hypothetical protein
MHVTDARAIRRLGVITDLGVGERDEVVDVELVRAHGHRAGIPLPQHGIAVGIDLNAVALGVVEIDGLADVVIGKARANSLAPTSIFLPESAGTGPSQLRRYS